MENTEQLLAVSRDITQSKEDEAARERIQERKRNIAQQLQKALIPDPPVLIPGLQIASHYAPALDEAGVGGDFLDVFPLKESATVMVVADVSGKGLLAAAQVATIRNMLRCLLYEGQPVGTAIARLNVILSENALLLVFATLFVGIYSGDSTGGTLTFVNCGQEPGLLWRAATGIVEELSATGAVLGGFAEAVFETRSVRLASGDTLALFTDGLTEVGPTRRNLLEIEGVTALFSEACYSARENSIRDVVTRLVAGVDAFAQQGVRDDTCLLVVRLT